MKQERKPTIWSYYRGENPHITEFSKEHGDRSVQRGDWFYFADGAIRGWGAYGELIGPPSDDIERQQLVVQFWEHALSKATEHFYNYRNNVARYNSENSEIMANLLFLQKQAKDCKRERRAAKDQLLCLKYEVDDVKEARQLRDAERERAAENLEREEYEAARAQGKAMSIRI